MSQRKSLFVAGVVLFVVVAGLGLLLAGHQLALRDLTFKNVSATQAAQAMKNDEFFTDYKENILVIHGTVTSVSRQGADTIVGLKANSSYKALCKLTGSSRDLKVGGSITVEAIGGNAVRQPAAVLLQNCISV